ncbi:MAG: PAS domain S-box protein [Emcibacter sp.]|nr:PAS domain S-box protein [Emcibacter sp.]
MISKDSIAPTGKEIFFPEDQLIVSKTNLKGKITYTNILFETMSGYTRDELLGQPHNIIRHPDMPQSIFKLFWDTLQQKKEIFAYVINMHTSGDHYWVLAHVVPTYDLMGNHIGYHSSRRCPNRNVIRKMQTYYQELNAIEKSHSSPKQGMQAALDSFNDLLKQQNISYAEYIFSMNEAA